MKKIALLVLLLCAGKVYAQQNSDYNNNQTNNTNTGKRATVYDSRTHTYSTITLDGSNNDNSNYNSDQIRLVDSTQEIRADIVPYKSDPKIKNDRYYFWYLNKVIHSTQGGYSGQLLNGHYISYYPDKNLKEEGDFKRGLKDGTWKTWNQKGDLTSVVTWDEGMTVTDNQPSIFKKIPFLNKKDAQQPAANTTDNP